MFVWVGVVIVYPNLILSLINSPEKTEARTASVFNQLKQVWKEFDRDRKDFLVNDPVQGEVPDFNIEWTEGYSFEYFKEDVSVLQHYYKMGLQMEAFPEKFEYLVPYAQNYYGFLGPRQINTTAKSWLIRKQALQDLFVLPATVERAALRLSPVGIYDAATQAWAGTDLNGIQDFFIEVRRYRQTMIDYFYEKNVFASRQWFASDKGNVDWSALPQFSFQGKGAGTKAIRAFPDVCLLLIVNLLLFMVIFMIFAKSEV